MQESKYQVIVVGSGAGGGMMAYNLTQAGINVLMLESGRDYDPRTETNMFGLPGEAPLRDTGTPDKPGGYYDATIQPDFSEEPFNKGEGNGHYWNRVRMLGGRTHHWGRQVPRYGPDDFKMRTNTGYEIDWPVSYEEMAPYYDRVETLIGVFSSDEKEAIHNSPLSPNHIRQQPPAPRIAELLFAKACKELGWKTMARITAILTKPLGDRSACFYATDCKRGCSIGAAFDSVTGFIVPAKKTGKLTVATNAIVSRVLMDKESKKAVGVRYIDKKNGEYKDVSAQVVVLAASTIETCRLLLNSKNEKHPDGLGNSSGLLGKYLSDTLTAGLSLQVPTLENLPKHNQDGTSQPHVYAPWKYHSKNQGREDIDFSGGYKLDVFTDSLGIPSMGMLGNILSLEKGLYGKALKKHMRQYYGSTLTIVGFGGMSLNEKCYVTIDPELKDKWGIPAPKIHWTSSDEDYRRMVHMYKTIQKVAEKMNAVVIRDYSVEFLKAGKITFPVGCSHELGGCRMGDNPQTSVVNAWSQSWDVPNLYVADGSPFVTHSEKNPTLTIMALSLRASDNIIKRLKENAL